MDEQKNVLVVSDHAYLNDLYELTLQKSGYHVHRLGCSAHAPELVAGIKHSIDAVFFASPVVHVSCDPLHQTGGSRSTEVLMQEHFPNTLAILDALTKRGDDPAVIITGDAVNDYGLGRYLTDARVRYHAVDEREPSDLVTLLDDIL